MPGVAALAHAYDGFILDQWGVLHDGTRPYPGAIDCLQQLRGAGKQVVILSNSGRREAGNIRLMAEIGFDPALYDRFISAGESAREAVGRRADRFHARLGRRYYAFTRGEDASLLDGLALERVAHIEAADFLMVIGIDSPRLRLADYEARLALGAARHLPMVCANPDLTRVSPDGLVDAPGALAHRYEALGGEVFYHGKPHAPIYEACFRALAGYSRERIVAIGDSIEHDVLGAARVGLRSAFVAGGIHAAELGASWGELPDPARWRQFLEAAEARPDHLVATFTW
ncbi:MAG: TIGR01459 family HAD-type hydrolase [Usitatibacter sp.]